ncbi:MAG: SulP family inorganic anion transporter, partial [Nitrospirota bacterium]|nr:SulP family inorganic anion transporter [Nitrospirota bacterium]
RGPLLGHPGSDQGVFKALAMLPEQVAAPNPGALAVAGAALAVMLFLPARLRRLIPPPLLALLAGTGVSLWLFPEVRVIGPIPHGLPHFVIPSVDPETFPVVLRGALALALLGAIDSVLTSLIADSLTRSRHDPNREMIGQGIGNAMCGLFGAVAGSGATMRTAVNVRSGGRTRLSGALHAVVLLALVLGLSPLVEHIPMAALAAVLLKVGWDIIDWPFLRLVVKADRQEMLVMFTVLLLTVLVDLLTAVAVGLIMASLVSARNLSAHQAAQLRLVSSDVGEAPFSEVERELIRRGRGQILLLHLSGPFSFCSSKDLVHRLAGIGAPYKAAVLDLSDTVTLDTSVAMAIGEILGNLAQDGITAFVSGMEGQVARDLARMGVLDPLPAERRVATRIEALHLAVAAAEGAKHIGTTPPAA